MAPHRDAQPVHAVEVAQCCPGGRGVVVERPGPQRAERSHGVVAGDRPSGAPLHGHLAAAPGGGGEEVEPVSLQVHQARDEPRLEDVGVRRAGQLGAVDDVPGAANGVGDPVAVQVQEAQHSVPGHVCGEVAVALPATDGVLGCGAGPGVVEHHEPGEGELTVDTGSRARRRGQLSAALDLGDALGRVATHQRREPQLPPQRCLGRRLEPVPQQGPAEQVRLRGATGPGQCSHPDQHQVIRRGGTGQLERDVDESQRSRGGGGHDVQGSVAQPPHRFPVAGTGALRVVLGDVQDGSAGPGERSGRMQVQQGTRRPGEGREDGRAVKVVPKHEVVIVGHEYAGCRGRLDVGEQVGR